MSRKMQFMSGISIFALLFAGLVLLGCPSEDKPEKPAETAATPTAIPGAGTMFYYGEELEITLSTTTAEALIYYTTGSGDPDVLYTTPIKVSGAKTIKAVAKKQGMTDSAPLTAAYTLNLDTRPAGLYDGESTTPIAGVAQPFSLANALAKIKTLTDNDKDYNIVFDANETTPAGRSGPAFVLDAAAVNNATGIKIRLLGTGDTRTLQLNNDVTGAFFRIATPNITLIIDKGIIIKGISPNGNSSLITLADGGKLELSKGAAMTGNGCISDNILGGVVYMVGTGNSFTMNGGIISDNTITAPGTGNASGSTVQVRAGSSFTMNDGIITNNTVTVQTGTPNGAIYNDGNFTMNGGIITGNHTIGTGVTGNAAVVTGNAAVFKMSGNAKITEDNEVVLTTNGTTGAAITLGTLTGSGLAAKIDLRYTNASAAAIGTQWDDKPIIKWDTGLSGALPVNRFSLGSWLVGGTAASPISKAIDPATGKLQ